MRRSAGERFDDWRRDQQSSGAIEYRAHAGDFAILIAPSSNRVYSGTAGKTMEAELRVFGDRLGERETIILSADKERFKAGDVQTLEYARADTTKAGKIYGKKAFDIIVGDAPYGIQHGALQSSKRLARSPTELLMEAVPAWARLLRSEGALGLAWNVHLTTFEELAEILTRAGLHVECVTPFRSFRHKVDQAIDRDIIVARKLLDRAAPEKS